ncbi:MAG: hypothetical protein N2746_01155 [Deltaproteobacteria bacterium]|nr:hypothetical protein [Deltaproteobacteria bacterium]
MEFDSNIPSEKLDEDLKEERSEKKRPIVVSIVMILLSLGLMYYYFEDIAFFFAKPEPLVLGDAERLLTHRLKHNSYISVSGIPDPRMLRGDSYVYFFFTKKFNYYVFMGNTNIIVKEPVELNKSRREEGLDTGPRIGRFIRFDRYFNQRELAQAREFFTKKLGRHFDDKGGVLVVGERPYGDFVTLVVYLVLLSVLFYNLIDIYKRVKKWKVS